MHFLRKTQSLVKGAMCMGLLCAGLFTLSSTVALSAVSDLEPPPNQVVTLTLIGRGVQIYKCAAVSGASDKFEWVLKGPEADLFDNDGHKVGRHFAGPTWELNDGGKVVGHVKAKADAPDGKSIPWLLLDAIQASGTIMCNVQSIQRVDTVGGKAPVVPADAGDLGQEKRVEYSATYKFYSAK
jgi:Protein of unknown function (DUF3455)